MIEYATKFNISVITVEGLKGAYLVSNVAGRLKAVSCLNLQRLEWNPTTKEWKKIEQPATRSNHPPPRGGRI